MNWATLIPLKTKDDHEMLQMVSSSCSSSGTHCVTQVISNEWGNVWIWWPQTEQHWYGHWMGGPDLSEIEYTVHTYQDVHVQVKLICDIVAEKIIILYNLTRLAII